MSLLHQQAELLARLHYEIDETLTHVYLIDVPFEESQAHPAIRLLEVNEFTPDAGIMPLSFAPIPDQGLTFPSIIVEVSPNEFQKILSGDLQLPEGWSIGEHIPQAAVSAN